MYCSKWPQDWKPENLNWLLTVVPLTECGKVTKAYPSLRDTGLLLTQSLVSALPGGFAIVISECLVVYFSIITLSQGKFAMWSGDFFILYSGHLYFLSHRHLLNSIHICSYNTILGSASQRVQSNAMTKDFLNFRSLSHNIPMPTLPNIELVITKLA